VEFFTKRGRPLSKDELLLLVEEDRKQKDMVAAKKRAEEEAEARRNQRIDAEIDEEEDYDTQQAR
jgi:hypothetical protein